jgi:hypothetical protein
MGNGSGGLDGGGVGVTNNVIGAEDSVGPYLQGAAEVTRANAEYQQALQEARLAREKANQEHLVTRRRTIEQAEWERSRLPDPETVRQEQLARALDRARVSPPLTEIWSGEPLNVLLRNLAARQSQRDHGPNVPLSEEVLESINLAAGDTRGHVGLLKDGPLQWPRPLDGEAFQKGREAVNRGLRHAVKAVQLKGRPDRGTLKALRADLKELRERLDASVHALSPDESIQAARYLKLVGNTVTALEDPNVFNHFNGNWTARGENVSELVNFMAEKGLRFAPAAPGDEPAYLALYHALAAYDAGVTRVADAGVPSRMPGADDE